MSSEWNHRTFRGLYGRLARELAEMSIFDLQSYKSHRDSRPYFSAKERERLEALEYGFAANCARIIERLPSRLETAPGISAVIRRPPARLSNEQKSQLAVYTTLSILETPSVLSDMDIDVDDQIEGSGTYAPIVLGGPDISGPLSMMFDYLPEVKRDIIAPVPQSVSVLDLDVFFGMVGDPSIIIESGRDLADAFVDARVAATRESVTLRRVFDVDLESFSDEPDVLNIGLRVPSLAHLPPQDAYKLRTEYQEEFRRFQLALADLSAGIDASSDDARLRLLLQKVAAEVRHLQDLFDKLKRQHRSLDRVLVFMSVVLCLGTICSKVPGLAAFLQAALSGAWTTGALAPFSKRAELGRIEHDPLYFAVRVHQAANTWTKRRPK